MRWARVLVVTAAVASLVVMGAGCGADGRLARQEAVARARTCASLEERHSTLPVTTPPWQAFLAHAAEKSDTQRDHDARQQQNAGEIKADCKIAMRTATVSAAKRAP